jgi:hypothetical protein
MKRLAFLAILLSAAPASADFISIYGRLHAGASFGNGISGDQKDEDFFSRSRGFAYGFLVGAKVLILEGWIEHDRFTSFSENKGTWTEFMLGGGVGLPLGVVPVDIGVRFGLGYGLGTGADVSSTSDNTFSDKGLVAEIAGELKYKFNPIVSMGVSVPFRFCLLFKSDAPAGQSDKYTSFSFMGLVFLQLSLGI